MKNKFQQAKQGLFNKLYDNLNEKQREAVFSVNGPLLILAGAGSGKTTVLVERIAHMIRFGDSYYADAPESITQADIEELENAVSLSKEQIAEVLDKYAVGQVPAWSILSITFTNKAANEMKTRLEKKVGDKANDI